MNNVLGNRLSQTAIPITLILVSCMSIAYSMGLRSPGVSEQHQEMTGYRVGDQFHQLPGMMLGQPTLVIYVRSSCRFCTASMPLYRRLQSLPKRAKIVAISTEELEVTHQYLSTHAWQPDQTLRVRPGLLRFPGTPAIALLRSDGSVLASWVGQLSLEEEEIVARAATGSSPH